jgi:CheY-like chemotaxis protein
MGSLREKKILLIEDDEISQFLIEKMISVLGCKVQVAPNGVEAMGIVMLEQYDMILMDIEMPVISGYETCRRFREAGLDWLSEVPIIGISANPLESSTLYLEKGMNAFIHKPIMESELLETIKKYLED